MLRPALGCSLLLALLAAPLASVPTEAAFPGANGAIVFESTRDGDNEIYVMAADGSGVTQLTFNTATDSAPRWSADGSRIVFASNRDGDHEIFVMNANGSGQTQLTFNTGSDGSPAWSPDGTRIVFVSTRDRNHEIYVMNADGSGQTRLTTNFDIDTEPVWSPDGSKILFYSDRDGDFELFVMTPTGAGVTQLTFNTAVNDVQPDWSPDGTRIVFARGAFGTSELDIWVMNADGSGQLRLTHDGAVDNVPSFSPDGTRVVFSSDRERGVRVFVMNADGSQETAVATGQGFLPDWQPTVATPGLVSHWRAEGNALDSVGTNHGQLRNGVGFVGGAIGQALSFDGVDDVVVVPGHTSLNPLTQMTIAAWVNASALSLGRPIVQRTSARGGGGYLLESTGSLRVPGRGVRWTVWSQGLARRLETPANLLYDGVWHHVAVTYNGTSMRIYIDGFERARTNATGGIDPVPDAMGIGGDVLATQTWDGALDDVRLYSVALDWRQIRGLAADGPPPPSAGSLQFAQGVIETTEGAGKSVRVKVVRTGGSHGPVSVPISTANGTATTGLNKSGDYEPIAGNLVFAHGEVERDIHVIVNDDNAIEQDETLQLRLGAPTGGATLGTPSTATLVIHDNDPNVRFQTAVSSHAETFGLVQLEVKVNSTPRTPITVDYAVTGGTAGADDYRMAVSGRLTFSGRTTTQRIPITIVNDPNVEPDETIVIELSNVVGAKLGSPSRHTLTILANDLLAPDSAGETADTARVLDLDMRPRQSVQDNLWATELDFYRIELDEGDFLAIDVDPVNGGPGVGALGSSTLAILAADGVRELANIGASQEPDSFSTTPHPAYGFRAPETGVYYLRLRTTQGAPGGYSMAIHRTEVADEDQDPAALDVSGAMYAWLEGDGLSIVGPTGYGFTLGGNWVQTTTVEENARGRLYTTTYKLAAGSAVTLRYGLTEVGIGSVRQTVTVRTLASRFGDVLGQLKAATITLDIGLPIEELLEGFEDRFGIEFGLASAADRWQIRLGSSVASALDFKPVMRGVPYLVFNGEVTFNLSFGAISQLDVRHQLLIAFNPVDPSFAVRLTQSSDPLEKPSVHLSQRGFVPYRPDLAPTAPGAIAVTTFYGHAYASWELPIGGTPVSWRGRATVDLDANEDGQWLGGGGNANQLFKGELQAAGNVLQDLNLGFNGLAVYHHTAPGPDFDFVLGRASAAYNGVQEGLWFKGQKGVENPWADTPLSALEMNQEDVLEGTIFLDGRFFLSTGSTMNLPGDSELRYLISISNQAFLAEVTGTLKFSGGVTINGVGATCSTSASARGSLEIGYSSGLDFAGSLRIEGKVRCEAGGVKVASASFNARGEITNDRIVFDLPYLGDVSVRLP